MQCRTINLPGLAVAVTALAATFGAVANEPAGQTLAAGAESTVVVPQTGARLNVFLPTNYRSDAKWPAIFFFPGQGGAPSTALIRHYTGDRDYIVIGLPYVTPESDKPLPDFADRELQNFFTARQWLATHASMDEVRVYLGGVSKGGWTTSLLGESELPHLAGLIILLAGRSFPVATAPGGAAYRGKPIYIGDGETDNNMRPARQATTFFQLRGAAVTFEEYPGLGHKMPDEAPRLRAWLLAQNRYATHDAVRQAELNQWFTNAVAAVRAAVTAGEKFRRALDLVRDPRLWFCAPPAGATAQQVLQEATARSPAKEEWAAENTYWNLLWKSINLRTLDELRATRDGFLELSRRQPPSRWGQLAAEDYRLLADTYDRTLAARSSTTNITTRTGVNNRGIPVPRWSGNKIIFDR